MHKHQYTLKGPSSAYEGYLRWSCRVCAQPFYFPPWAIARLATRADTYLKPVRAYMGENTWQLAHGRSDR
jgi:hypothetical protein